MVCRHKRKYGSKEAAEVDAQRIEKESGEFSKAYHCPHCNQYHVTSKRERKNKKTVRRREQRQRAAARKKIQKFNDNVEIKNNPFLKAFGEKE